MEYRSRDIIAVTKAAMAFVFHGIGTMFYGERDYWPDGSFISTEWFVLAWEPLIPICSKRISYTRNSDYAVLDASGYYVYEVTGLNYQQVFSVYGWFTSLVAPLILWGRFQDELARMLGNEDRAAGLVLMSMAIVFVWPYFLAK